MQTNACLSCRDAKLRCALDTFGEHGKCRRCHISRSECVFRSIDSRQRRKRIDTRVASLERQLAEMGASTKSVNAAESGGACRQAYVPQPSPAESKAESNRASRRMVPSRLEVGGDTAQAGSLSFQEVDRATHEFPQQGDTTILGASFLSLDCAEELFAEFISHVLPQYPILAYPSDVDCHSLRKTCPILFLAIVTASSRSSDPALFQILNRGLLQLLSDRILVQGQKSVELVQSILTMEAWYDPPEEVSRLNFYNWVQLAGNLARQLGLWPWSEEASTLSEQHVDDDVSQDRPQSDATMAGWRTAFATYLDMST